MQNSDWYSTPKSCRRVTCYFCKNLSYKARNINRQSYFQHRNQNHSVKAWQDKRFSVLKCVLMLCSQRLQPVPECGWCLQMWQCCQQTDKTNSCIFISLRFTWPCLSPFQNILHTVTNIHPLMFLHMMNSCVSSKGTPIVFHTV